MSHEEVTRTRSAAGTPRFSLVIPTRNRPDFVAHALTFISASTLSDFEVVICDNASDPRQSCRAAVLAKDHLRITYVRASGSLSMVDNWNLAMSYATGEYVAYFTDKMMLLPGTLAQAARVLDDTSAEIVTWPDNAWLPDTMGRYFDRGTYLKFGPKSKEAGFSTFEGRRALTARLDGRVARTDMARIDYARGKICFGAYARLLIGRIVAATGALFHPLSPDYTSMTLALALAKGGVELMRPGVVHMQTDLSNGLLAERDDRHALNYYASVPERQTAGLYIPGLYCSTHNAVLTDYVTMLALLQQRCDIDPTPWLALFTEDLDRRDGHWSSPGVRDQQYEILARATAVLLDAPQADRLRHRLQSRATAARRSPARTKARVASLLDHLPGLIRDRTLGILRGVSHGLRERSIRQSVRLAHLDDIIEHEMRALRSSDQ